MSTVDRIRLLVLQSDPIAREGILATFAKYPDLEVVSETEAFDYCSGTAPRLTRRAVDVVVADYECGLELARDLAQHNPPGNAVKVLIVTSCEREWEIRKALEVGVRGYVAVGCRLDELAAGVRAVHRGARHLSPQVAERLAESMGGETLTTREEEVLRLVSDGLGNKAIARTLGIAVGTVKSHLKGVFDKLHVDSRTQAICAAKRRGILSEAPQERAQTSTKSYLASLLKSQDGRGEYHQATPVAPRAEVMESSPFCH